MGIINKIREKTGLAVGIVALGLILFLIGGDILGPNSVLLGRNQNIVGEIAGEDIRIEDYQQVIEQVANNYAINYGRNPDAQAMQSIREEAWQILIRQIAYREQYKSIGLAVADAEIVDMVQGEHIRNELKEAFKDPETGDFDKEQVISYLRNVGNMPADRQNLWYSFEENLRPSRLLEKYNNLFTKTHYVTTHEAQYHHKESNESISLRYLYIPYRNFHDTLFEASDKELQSYLKKHAKEYQREQSRSMRYVTFPIIASSEDSAYTREESAILLDAFSEAEDDSLFAQVHSEGRDPFKAYTLDALPQALAELPVATWRKDTVLGPFLEKSNYTLYKISLIKDDSIPYVRASHILIKSENEDSKPEAKKKAEKILREIQGGESFEAMARLHGTDNTTEKGGDLGWFTKGRMVAPFEEVVFEATQTGLLPRVVDTDFGYHIVKITQVTSYNSYHIARIEKEIAAGENTRNVAYAQAAAFVSHSQDTTSFQSYVEKHGLFVETANKIGPNQQHFGKFSQARQVVAWLFREASIGVVSDIFEMEDNFVVGMMEKEQPQGLANYEDIKATLSQKVSAQKKAAHINMRLDTLLDTEAQAFERIAAAFPEGAYVYSMPRLKLSESLLSNVGAAPKAIGIAFSLQEGERSAPITEDKGILLLELESKTPSTEPEDYKTVIEQLQQQQSARAATGVGDAIKKMSDIKDKRYKFF